MLNRSLPFKITLEVKKNRENKSHYEVNHLSKGSLLSESNRPDKERDKSSTWPRVFSFSESLCWCWGNIRGPLSCPLCPCPRMPCHLDTSPLFSPAGCFLLWPCVPCWGSVLVTGVLLGLYLKNGFSNLKQTYEFYFSRPDPLRSV